MKPIVCLFTALLLTSPAARCAEESPALPSLRYHGVLLESASLKYRPHDDLIFPSVVRMEGCVKNPLGKFYLYYAPHDAPGGICLAYADRLEGPWQEYTNNPIIARTWPPHYTVSHVSGPDAIWNEEEGKVFLYFHGENSQTRLATSADGIHFDYAAEVISTNMFASVSEASYGRVFRHTLPGHDNRYIMLLMGNDQGTRRIYLAWSKDGRKWETRPKPLMNPPPGTDQVAGAALLSWGEKFYLVAHANNSKVAFNEGFDLYLAETDAALEHIRPLGKFFERTTVSPTNPGVMSPCFIEDEGRLCMFFNIGARLRNKIALAIAESGVPQAALAAVETPTPPARPNILWIIMDDVGAELPCYGEKHIQTPNIDRLVREGTKFDRAFLTASVCSPSRSAMITGMYQTSIGAHHHRSGHGTEKIHLPAGVEPVPALFQRAGYFTCNGHYPTKAKRVGKTDYNFEWDAKIYDSYDWANRKPGQPFFAQLQLWGGKNRNDRGRWYREVAPKALGTLTKPEDVTLPPYYPRDPVFLEDWAQYLDCIRYCDLQVGEILKRLESEGILDQTIIILMGDNGISQARGKQFLYDEGIRTPFIVRGPGIARSAVRSELIEHIDMAATSLAWAGLPVPSSMQGRDLFAKDYQPREAVFAARDRCGETVDRIRSVRTEQFKYIRNFHPQRPLLQPNDYKDSKLILQRLRELRTQGKLSALQEEILFSPTRPVEELYDMQADPFEIRNLAGDPRFRSTLETLRTRLDRWMAETHDSGPESEKAYDANVAYELKTPAAKARGNDAVLKNITLMKQWAKEGK